jgi:ATP-binding cassette subfamily F protein uup
MSLLSVSDLHKGYGSRVLFEGVSMGLEAGESVGLIGVNGSGKTTLLRIIAGEETPDGGSVALQTGATVGYLSQEPSFDPALTILEVVESGHPELQALLTRYHDVSRSISEAAAGGASEEEMDRLLRLQSSLSGQLDGSGGWDWEHRAQAMLTRVGVPEWDRPTSDLSGGERRRISLARALLAQPDLLLLDEPTNHLDADTVLWLEETLVDYPGSIILITHDRYFLDRVVDRTYEVSVDQLIPFDGGYTEYLEEKAARTERQGVEAEKRLKLIQKELDWARRAPPARTGKQRARLKRIREIKSSQEKYRSGLSRDLAPPPRKAPRLGRSILELAGVAKGYGGRSLFHDLDLSLRSGERIGVIGPNGVGKTTLLRVLMGLEEPDAGSVHLGANTRVAYFDQRRADLDPDRTIYSAAADTDWVEVGGRRIHLRSYLERFLFPVARQSQKISTLSGGERSRLILARMLLEPANLLVLDEPTNDLDLLTLQVLEDILLEFSGCVILVTHDRYLLDKVATSMLAFDGEGGTVRIEGGYDRYRAWKESRQAEIEAREAERKERERTQRKAREAAESLAHAADRPRKLTWKEARELEALEERIGELEEERSSLESTLADPSFYSGPPDRIRTVRDRFTALEEEMEKALTRWAYLEERRG